MKVLLLLSTWTVILWWTVTGQPHNFAPARVPITDKDYHPSRGLDIVLSRYSEDLDEVFHMLDRITSIPSIAELEPKVIVYDKGERNRSVMTGPKMPTALSTGFKIEYVDRPNIGRESETYLWHMSNRYDNLAVQTLFMQAGLEHWRSALARIKQYHVANTGFLSLAYPGQVCWDRTHCGDTSHWFEHGYILNHLQNLTNADTGPSVPLVRTYKAQFFASAARIRGVPRESWEAMHSMFVDPDSEAHREPYLQPWNQRIRVDKMSAPILGFTFERLWGDLMQCSEMRIAERCPSLLSGLYGWKGELEDCECLDGDSNSETD